VPYLIKDSGPMAKGVPFFLGSRAVQGAVAPYDTDLMTRFRAAGLATLGLTTVPELVISFSTESLRYEPTRNPRDLERGVGGSSGGAAALVAGHLLEEMGHAVTEASPAVDWDAVMRSATTEAVSIVAPVLMAPRRPDPARMEAVSRELIRVAEGFSALELMAGLDAQNQVTRSVGTFFTAYDLLFQVAARLEEAVPWRGRTPPVSVTRSYSGGHV
jgi:Amidase